MADVAAQAPPEAQNAQGEESVEQFQISLMNDPLALEKQCLIHQRYVLWGNLFKLVALARAENVQASAALMFQGILYEHDLPVIFLPALEAHGHDRRFWLTMSFPPKHATHIRISKQTPTQKVLILTSQSSDSLISRINNGMRAALDLFTLMWNKELEMQRHPGYMGITRVFPDEISDEEIQALGLIKMGGERWKFFSCPGIGQPQNQNGTTAVVQNRVQIPPVPIHTNDQNGSGTWGKDNAPRPVNDGAGPSEPRRSRRVANQGNSDGSEPGCSGSSQPMENRQQNGGKPTSSKKKGAKK